MNEVKVAERRHHVRHRANTKVRVKTADQSKVCSVVDLAPNGVGIKTSGMDLSFGEEVQLTFMVNLGYVIKMHHRQARVQHTTSGITGFSMFPPNRQVIRSGS